MTDFASLETAGVLTVKEREVMELLYRHGLSERTCADSLGVSRSAVRARKESAHRKIRLHQGKEAA